MKTKYVYVIAIGFLLLFAAYAYLMIIKYYPLYHPEIGFGIMQLTDLEIRNYTLDIFKDYPVTFSNLTFYLYNDDIIELIAAGLPEGVPNNADHYIMDFRGISYELKQEYESFGFSCKSYCNESICYKQRCVGNSTAMINLLEYLN